MKDRTAQTSKRLRKELETRILVMDGAMGTQIQALQLDESDFRGDRFRDHPSDLKGNNELLVLTQPEAIRRTGSLAGSLAHAMMRLNALYQAFFAEPPAPAIPAQTQPDA